MTERITTYFPFAIDPFTFIQQNKGCLSLVNSNDKKGVNYIAFGAHKQICLKESKDAFDKLKEFQNKHNDWMFGILSYDLKNDVEQLESKNENSLDFPLLHFYVPELLIELCENETKVFSIPEYPKKEIEKVIQAAQAKYVLNKANSDKIIIHGPTEEEYLEHFKHLSAHIQQGDIYEVNYCLNFYSDNLEIDPLSTYFKLNVQTEAPFSSYYSNDEHFLLCGSPERYIKKNGQGVLSQPIKGTIKRGLDEEEDLRLKKQLRNDPKEQAENVMIVDLVRNDLSRIAQKGSVNVDELFGVYSFKTVHQLISTVSCKAKKEVHSVDIIKATFPMGSMTGAPKIRAMQLIDKHEDFRRGIYSGAFGYFKPNGDFDFNVVIRSIMCNEKKRKVSFPVGGAITSLAKGKEEYKECILKAKAMKKAIQND